MLKRVATILEIKSQEDLFQPNKRTAATCLDKPLHLQKQSSVQSPVGHPKNLKVAWYGVVIWARCQYVFRCVSCYIHVNPNMNWELGMYHRDGFGDHQILNPKDLTLGQLQHVFSVVLSIPYSWIFHLVWSQHKIKLSRGMQCCSTSFSTPYCAAIFDPAWNHVFPKHHPKLQSPAKFQLFTFWPFSSWRVGQLAQQLSHVSWN